MVPGNSPEQVAIYGGGGFGREVAWLISSCNVPETKYEITCFIEDKKELIGKRLNGYPVLSFSEAVRKYPETRIVLGVGNPHSRLGIVDKVLHANLEVRTIIHPGVQLSPWVEIGNGTVICTGSVLTTNITLGNYVQINLNCTIGHDAILKDFATLAPGVHISGSVHVGRLVYIGTGATIINGTQDNPIEIGDGAVIGAGACVTKSVENGVTVVGIPARPIKGTGT